MIKIMIADDEPLQRQYLRTVLEDSSSQYKVVAEAANGEEAVTLGLELKPDIVFLDIRMRDLTALRLPVACG